MRIETLDGEAIELRTGDELLCSGTGPLSKLIIWFNELAGIMGPPAELSHVAKFISGDVFEATTLNKWCLKKGYQSNPFPVWLQNYPGRVWVRQLTGVDIDEFKYFQTAYGLLGTPYENGIPGFIELLMAGILKKIPFLSFISKRMLETTELHCSEANVKLSQKMRYYNKSVKPNKMPPSQFWPGGRYDKGLIVGALGEPKRLK